MASEAFLVPSSECEAAATDHQELQFLNVTGSAELDEVARTTIRAQSLRDYHRKRRARIHLRPGPCKPQSGQGTKSQVQRFRLDLQGLKPTQTQPQPVYIRKAVPLLTGKSIGMEEPIGSRIFDPFDMLPLPSTPKLRLLVKQRKYGCYTVSGWQRLLRLIITTSR